MRIFLAFKMCLRVCEKDDALFRQKGRKKDLVLFQYKKGSSIFVLGCVWLCILVKEDLVLFQMQER